MILNNSNKDLTKFESFKKIPFYDLKESFFPKNVDLNKDFSKDCYLYMEDENDINNPKLKLTILPLRHFKTPREDSSTAIYISKLTGKLNLRILSAGESKIFLDGTRGNWNIKLGNKSSIIIGKVLQANNVKVICEQNGHVFIDDDCLFSDGIILQCGDGHGIISLLEKNLINSGRSVINIGKHFWCGRNANIITSSKYLNIGSGSILGFGSILTKSMPENSIFAGNPAKIIRDNVSWTRERYPSASEINKVINELNNNQ